MRKIGYIILSKDRELPLDAHVVRILRLIFAIAQISRSRSALTYVGIKNPPEGASRIIGLTTFHPIDVREWMLYLLALLEIRACGEGYAIRSVPNTTCYGLAGEVEWLVHLAPQRTVGELGLSLGAYAIV